MFSRLQNCVDYQPEKCFTILFGSHKLYKLVSSDIDHIKSVILINIGQEGEGICLYF